MVRLRFIAILSDLICLGKALTNGFPLSACVGRAAVDRVWPASEGEAIHTSTYLGHPVGCAMALAQIKELKEKNSLPKRADLGRNLKSCTNVTQLKAHAISAAV